MRLKDGGFPEWTEANKTDSLIMHLIFLSATNCISTLNENTRNNQYMHVSNDKKNVSDLKLHGFPKYKNGGGDWASLGSTGPLLESHSNSPPVSTPTPI